MVNPLQMNYLKPVGYHWDYRMKMPATFVFDFGVRISMSHSSLLRRDHQCLIADCDNVFIKNGGDDPRGRERVNRGMGSRGHYYRLP